MTARKPSFRSRKVTVVARLMKKFKSVVVDPRLPEARLFLAIIERGLIDAFIAKEPKWRDQARKSYLLGPVFKWNMSVLGISPDWGIERVAAAMYEITDIENEEVQYAIAKASSEGAGPGVVPGDAGGVFGVPDKA